MTHGPVVGAVTARTARVWLRTSGPASVKIESAADGQTQTKYVSGTFVSDDKNDFTLQIPLENLTPATQYDVTVWVNESAQPRQGRFRTFPNENNAAPFKMVILTDFGYLQAPVSNRVFELAAAENPDLVFIGGDFDHRDPKLVPAKRQMFQDLYSDDPNAPLADFAKFILHNYPLAYQWDDHDYGGDNSDRTATWRESALQVYREYFPSYPMGKYGIYQSFRYGKEVEVFVLDGRSQRDPNQTPDDANKSMLNGERHPDGQVQWLLDGLKNSTATWKLIMSPSVLNRTMHKTDSWANFSHERETILNFIKLEKIDGVIVIAGDLHGGALDDGRNAGIPSAVIPSVNLPTCMSVPRAKLGEWSHGVYGDALKDKNNTPCVGYGVVTMQERHARIAIKDGSGSLKLEMNMVSPTSFRSNP